MTPEDDCTVKRLVQEAIRRRKSGKSVDLSAIEKTDPGIAAEVRTRLAAKGVDLFNSPKTEEKVDQHLEQAHTSSDGLPVDEAIVSVLLSQLKRYRLIRQLGSGAMGEVYRAHDLNLSRDVAVKVPRIEGVKEQLVRERFRREAQAIAQLDHPGICRLHDFGEVGGLPYLTMTYIKGKPLSHFLATKQFQVRQAVVLVGRIAKALRHAHLQGVLHRDLKPANILINQEGKPIVTDFGLACFYDNSVRSRMTTDGEFMGSPAYMSPEQAQGDLQQIGPPADVYSLGVILYEMLTGQLPYIGTPMAIIGQLVAEHIQPPPASSIRADVDPSLDHICAKMLAKRIEDRYSSMAEVEEALNGYLRGRSADSGDSTGLTDEMGVMDLESPSSASNAKIAKVDKPQAGSHHFRPSYMTWGAVAIAMILMAGVSFTLLRDPSELTSNRNPSSVEPEIDEAPLPSVVKLFSQDVFKLEGPEFEQLSLNLASTDAASQNGVSYQLVGEIPEGCHINPQSGELEWKPGIDQGGEYKLHVEALLFGQPPQLAQVKLAIAKARPLLKTYESELTANEYEPFSEEVVASRDLGTIVQYAIVGEPPEGCTIDKKLGWLQWTPSEGQGGQRYEIEVEAQSLTRPPEQSALTINVGKAPALFGTFPERVDAEELFEVRIETAGPEVVGRMQARFELVGRPPVGCELDPITGVLRWKPGLDEGPRDYSFQVRATATDRKPELRDLTIHVEPSFKPMESLPIPQTPLPTSIDTAAERDGFRQDLRSILEKLRSNGINQRTEQREATSKYDKLIREFGQSDRVEYAYGLFLLKLRDAPSAAGHFSKLPESSIWSLDALEAMAWSHLEKAEYEQFKEKMPQLLERIREASAANIITEPERQSRVYWCGELVALHELLNNDPSHSLETLVMSAIAPDDDRCFRSGAIRMKDRFATRKAQHEEGQRTEREALQTKLDLSREEGNQLDQEIEEIRKQRDNLRETSQEKFDKLENSVNPLEEEKKNLINEMGPIVKDFEGAGTQLNNATERVNNLNVQIAAVSDDTEQLTRLQQQLAEAQATIKSSSQRIQQLAFSLEPMRKKLNELDASIDPLRRQLDDVKNVYFQQDKNLLQQQGQLKRVRDRRGGDAAEIQKQLDNLQPFQIRVKDYQELFDFIKRGERVIDSIPY